MTARGLPAPPPAALWCQVPRRLRHPGTTPAGAGRRPPERCPRGASKRAMVQRGAPPQRVSLDARMASSLRPARQLQNIADLEGAPAWARTDWEQDNPHAPPADMQDLARFAGAPGRALPGTHPRLPGVGQPNIFRTGATGPSTRPLLRDAAALSAAIRSADADAGTSSRGA
jgi:hypothetical protein